MTTNTVFLLFCAVLLVLGGVAFTLSRAKASRVRATGTAMHAQPDQYAWFAVLATAGPALLVSALGAFALLLMGAEIPTLYLLSASLIIATIGLVMGLSQVRPDFHARRAIEGVIRKLLAAAAMISILTTLGILLSIITEALRFFQMHSFWDFVTGTTWNPGASFLSAAGRGEEGGSAAQFGSIPLFAGTFMITLIAMLVAIPFGLGAAIYMVEFAPMRIRKAAKPVIEVLAGIPTVVYGVFAALTVAPLVVDIAGLFGLDASYSNALAPGLVMGIMIIPFISSLSDDVINSVPNSLREGALALGITKGEMVRNVVVPAAAPGIISASLLAVSRALGETMIVVMAAGMRPNLTANPLEDMTTVTVSIVAALTGDQEFESAQTLSAFALGLVLFVVTLTLNVVSVFMIRRFREKYRVNNL
ncbi:MULTISPECIES: phosphate ABC transporter permease subunit PstC [Chromohalobacter]|uniref:Phosphate transport system permease protein n=1 Tax=Chromohalobacter israelensis (strain ATCC BAA-138 / DSM 3043 / CIP 106854 / NCIMB 13768 / 1H11) TaxID=290398 RepID=Q1QXH8_CHRI1|nr:MULTISPECIES: phosphate ABC transporter permease subunit PstC [Chromohalobacter]ABE58830.1 phosphate ABC transporter membrane protein 1, PhoT family [Chromohalobacter salexigens DSM 3043]MBZ5877028.1 phosphate ABC transporter permease subunit PstC [Chromohalobacter salexigens]MDF9433712.1 phosphate ABC transporter permease subunit PstC [Chromohalobacter israelensis]MDO0944906.1 phosphate ABC transporter permease subunit PstC [Chromohalobacter salexigens]NQY44573.1 phosphate ABC transporter 